MVDPAANYTSNSPTLHQSPSLALPATATDTPPAVDPAATAAYYTSAAVHYTHYTPADPAAYTPPVAPTPPPFPSLPAEAHTLLHAAAPSHPVAHSPLAVVAVVAHTPSPPAVPFLAVVASS